MNEKQQQLTFDKGITNVPSDALCSDNALEDAIGMVYANGEHRVIQAPSEFMSGVGGELVYIHQDRYIVKYTDTTVTPNTYILTYRTATSTSLNFICNLDGDYEIKMTSIGKTAILSTPNGLVYLRWTGGRYKVREGSLPEIKVNFSLEGKKAVPSEYDEDDKYVNIEGMIEAQQVTYNVQNPNPGDNQEVAIHSWQEGRKKDAQSAIIGLVSKRLNEVKEDNRFAFPFWVRYAIRLYDDSYIHISNPVLMMPTVRHNCNAFLCWEDDAPTGTYTHKKGQLRNMYYDSAGSHWVNYLPVSAELLFKVSLPDGFNSIGDFIDAWGDVVKGVDVFVSREVRGFDIDDEWVIVNPDIRTSVLQEEEHNKPLLDFCWPEQDAYPRYSHTEMDSTPLQETETDAQCKIADSAFGCYLIPTHYTEKEIVDELIDSSVFYKIISLDLSDLEDEDIDVDLHTATDYIKKNTIVNLETQEQLDYDDYYSRSSLFAEVIKAYNSRLHLGDVKRGFFKGFEQFSYSAYSNGAGVDLNAVVYIESENGERIVKKELLSHSEIVSTWFYYPDPRAYRVEFYSEDLNHDYGYSVALPLKEHPHLNGAYYLKRLPNTDDQIIPLEDAQDEPAENATPEELPNYMLVSEVDNPYVFLAKGYHRVGMGRIIGLAIQTSALGQEEHGKHPLLVFMTKGIWTMMVGNTGEYLRPDSLSREVCVAGKSITETDGAVFFASKKGLMLLVGSQVKCVSEQLSGRSTTPFADYLKDAFIAYDYRDSLLWIFDGHKESNAFVGSRYCYVYAIKSGTFSRFDFGSENIVTNIVNNYPDYLLQIGTDVFSLLERPNINTDYTSGTNPRQYTASMETRPMKLENALALKSIMQVRHIFQFSPYKITTTEEDPVTHQDTTVTRSYTGVTSLRIFASNNLDHWVVLHSLRGTPWKYYKFRFTFTNLIATDRFAGTMLITQERRTDKLR